VDVTDSFKKLAQQFAQQPQPKRKIAWRRCWGCGVDFNSGNPEKRYCNDACKNRHQRLQAGRASTLAEPKQAQRAVSPEQYQAYIRSEDWRQKAERAKKRAGYRCQVCNHGTSDGRLLEAHHRTYERLGNEQPMDITVLCDECHGLFSSGGKLAK
jgi:Pyruvate/2-oxoacid:ferredoxin oxidoreductase delta subunit